jgi:DNA polymerase III alpha subunit
MTTPRYAELQVTSHFSFLRGASSCDDLFAQAAALGIEALAVVDRNSLAGIVRAHQAAKDTGVRLIVGCRLDLVDGVSVLVYPTDRAAYPEQPPIIPHSIEGYQLSVNANRCMSCHKREFTEGSGAPMISVTHYMTREGQMLADVSPRRYFCTACHVPQADIAPLVGNTFVDMSELGVGHAGDE